jgi:hypothetical protein
MKKLYILRTQGLGNYYVIATNLNDAESKLKQILDKADYGFSTNRKLLSIEVIAEEIGCFPQDIPFLSSGNNLIIDIRSEKILHVEDLPF